LPICEHLWSNRLVAHRKGMRVDYVIGESRLQRSQFREAMSFVRSIGACVVSAPSDQMLRVASAERPTRSIGSRLMLMSRAVTRSPGPELSCHVLAQPEMDVSGMKALAKTAQGVVFEVLIGGRRMVLKWTGSAEQNMPFDAGSEAMVESVVASAASSFRMSGTIPFFAATYCTFGCRLRTEDVKRDASYLEQHTVSSLDTSSFISPRGAALISKSWSGVAAIQEFVPYDFYRVLSSAGMDPLAHAGLVTLSACAIYCASEVMGVSHNDLHVKNIRCGELAHARMAIRWSNRWFDVRAMALPQLIDWGRACDRRPTGVCSDVSMRVYTKEGRPTVDSSDAFSLYSRLFFPMMDEYVPDRDSAIYRGDSIFGCALRFSTTPVLARSAAQVIAAIVLLDLMISSTVAYDAASGAERKRHKVFDVRADGSIEESIDKAYEFSFNARDRRPFIMCAIGRLLPALLSLWRELRSAPTLDTPRAILS
jgi:hypothetical protein